MKKKITVIVAVILCLAFALCGCGTANTKFTPEIQTRKITQAVNMAEGLENVTGKSIKKLGGSDSFASLYVVEGTQATGDKRRETRVFSYVTGDTLLTLADTAANKYNVCMLNDDTAIYVYTEPTDEELDLGQGDSNYVYTHYSAIYSRTGKLIAEKEEKNTYRVNPIDVSALVTSYKFTGSGANNRYFLRTYNDGIWEFNAKADYDLIAENVPFYNDPVDYSVKVNGYYYVTDDDSITVYDSVFNRVSVYNAPIYTISDGGASVYMLNNGNAIVQVAVPVPDSEKNYDYAVVASADKVVKCRVVTYLVNPIKGTEKKIKCGYIITNVYARATVSNMFNAYAAGVENIGFGFKIQDKIVNFNSGEIFVMGNNGKIGDSLKLVSNSSKNLLDTVDGNYFTLVDNDDYVHVYNKKLKEVKSYSKDVIGSFKKAGPYLIDTEEQIIYDYALNEIYRSPKDEDGSLIEDFFITSIGKYDYRIATVSKVDDTTAAFNEFRDGKIKQLFTFTEGGDETLEMGRRHLRLSRI